jgi:hypothetical protein
VPLSQQEVDEFMGAAKVVPRRSGRRAWRMTWDNLAPGRYRCRAPVEVDAAHVGELNIWLNASLDRHWSLKLRLHNEEVYRWDFAQPPCNHNNPRVGVCPPGFPRKVRECEQEHVWVKDWDLKCARPLEGFATSGFREIFVAFCDRTSIDFQPDYVAPLALAQLAFPDSVMDAT